jgi:integrase/recombinase XerC
MIPYFLQHIKYEKKCSLHTLTAYRTDLEQWEEFLKKNYDFHYPQLADTSMVRSWITKLGEEGLEKTSINRKIATLRTFFEFAQRRQIIAINPMSGIKALKKSAAVPTFLRETEMQTLLDDISFGEDFESQRDKLVLELLYGTGIRLAELLHLTERDIDFFAQHIIVLGKRNKHRIIPLMKPLVLLLQQYLALKTQHFSGNADPQLIVTDTGVRAYPMFVQRLVKRHLELVTTLPQKSPHVMRHTFATHLLNRGADLHAIKDLLGHTSLVATQVYTHNSIEELKKIYAQAHPKA